MVSSSIDLWFSVGSTYTYLSVMRVSERAGVAGIGVRWRPFSVRRIMREMDNRFLQGKPEKYAYMWRDIERRAAMHGIPCHVPVPHPIREFDAANRLAVVAEREGWCPEYVRATYRRWFVDGQEPGIEPNLSASLRELGEDPARVISLANSDEITAAYEAATDEARALGIFGAPTFAVERELFWGDDRLEDALNWRLNGSVLPAVAS